jgi:hypothetical protein
MPVLLNLQAVADVMHGCKRPVDITGRSESVRHLALRSASISPRRWLLSQPAADLPGRRSPQSH